MRLIGHGAAESSVTRALAGGRLHHGWLLAGPRGMGKAAFARDFAARIVDPAGAHRRLVEQNIHPDMLVIEREIHPDRKELRRNITVDQIRAMLAKLTRFPTLGTRRAIIIDSADDLEKGAANALLKGLEEPPAGTYFLLVAHMPGRLLPTIRSRCRLLQFDPLDDAAMRAFLDAAQPDMAGGEREALLLLAQGAPGRALNFAGLGLDTVARQLDDIERRGDPTLSARMAIADMVGRKEAAQLFDAVLDLFVARIAAAARRRADDGAGPLVDAWSEATRLVARARALTLDKPAVVMRLGDLLAEAAAHKDRAA